MKVASGRWLAEGEGSDTEKGTVMVQNNNSPSTNRDGVQVLFSVSL